MNEYLETKTAAKKAINSVVQNYLSSETKAKIKATVPVSLKTALSRATKARKTLEKGWANGRLKIGDNYCAIGALEHAHKMQMNEAMAASMFEKNSYLFKAAKHAFKEELTAEDGDGEVEHKYLVSAIENFNDSNDKKSVLGKFDKMINFLSRQIAKRRLNLPNKVA